MKSIPWDSLILGKDETTGYAILDRANSAEDLREVYETFFSNGVFLNDSDAFHVVPSDGMNVIVSAGKCCIKGTVGWEDRERALAIQSSDSEDRIDTVVLRWNANVEMRNIDLYVKAGTPAATPTRPSLTRTETVYELGIADIFVAKNSGAISAARITDTRLQDERCGMVTPLLDIDTTTFYDQLQEQTNIAVELAQSAIDGTVAGNLQSQIDDLTTTSDIRWEETKSGFMELNPLLDSVEIYLEGVSIPAKENLYVPFDDALFPDSFVPVGCVLNILETNDERVLISGPVSSFYSNGSRFWFTRIYNFLESKVVNMTCSVVLYGFKMRPMAVD